MDKSAKTPRSSPEIREDAHTLWLVYDGDCVLCRSPRRTRWLYPLLRAGRNLSLRLAGKTQI
jgi:predicted DCC family thiol-disulfide oxidoreductase YuxK